MRGAKIYVIAYDISDNKKRTQITKTLSDYGVRIQKSVFECLLNNEQKNDLLFKLRLVIKKYPDNADSLIVLEDIREDQIRYLQGTNLFLSKSKKYSIV
ncbi:CRISPR-associated endonuclease Cas2 [Filifactor villosus]|uniref:CRISPR-associated endoribonuclease Cas2 n=1 Tax=Filifactor villosus TaxID=29374 RepID=A0ABV9QL25_9FIRM